MWIDTLGSHVELHANRYTKAWFETTLNYWMMVERYPNLKEEDDGSVPGCEISSLLDRKLAMWSTFLCFGAGLSMSQKRIKTHTNIHTHTHKSMKGGRKIVPTEWHLVKQGIHYFQLYMSRRVIVCLNGTFQWELVRYDFSHVFLHTISINISACDGAYSKVEF